MRTIDSKILREIGQSLINIKDYAVKSASGNNEAVAVDGGNAVAGVISDQIFNANDAFGGTIINQARQCKVLRGPVVKMRSRVNVLANEPSTGIRTYWVSEADQSTASKINYRGQSLELGKLVCRVPMTAEIQEDVEQVGDTFVEDASISMTYKVEREMLMGTGKIKGVLTDGDDATISVAVAGAIPTEAELKLFVAAIHPMATAQWLVTQAVYVGITSIAYTTPNALQFEDGKYWLFGYEVVRMPHLEATPYNIVLADFTAYGLGYMEPRKDISDGVRFLFDESEYRLQMRVCGDAIAETATLDDGVLHGWFVCNSLAEANQSSSSDSSSSLSSESSLTSVSSGSSGSSLSSLSSLTSVSSGSSGSSLSSNTPG